MKDEQAGFSVVELLITLTIITIVFGSFLITFTTIQSINKKALDISRANSIAFAKVQEYENLNFSNLPDPSPSGSLQEVEDFSDELPNSLRQPRSAKVYMNSYSSSLRHIVVSISFGSSGDARVIEYGDFIHYNGVGR